MMIVWVVGYERAGPRRVGNRRAQCLYRANCPWIRTRLRAACHLVQSPLAVERVQG